MTIVRLCGVLLIVLVCAAMSSAEQPGDCGALIEGIQHRYGGRMDEAVTAFERAIFMQGDVSAAYLHLGLTWELRGDRVKAREYYDRALQINPNYRCARHYRSRLSEPPVGRPLVTTAAETVTPRDIVENFSRYRGQRVQMKGQLMCWPCTKGPRPLMLVSTNPVDRAEADGNLVGVFIVRLNDPLPDDPRVRRGATVEVRGVVIDRDFAYNPLSKVFSTDKKPVLRADVITIEEEQGYTGPLRLQF